MDLLPHDLIISILSRVDVKTLGKMKVVSKLWKSIIENRNFQKRQQMHRRESKNPDVLLVPKLKYTIVDEATTMLVGSAACCVKIFAPLEYHSYNVCKSSCDGLICIYKDCHPNMVFNPTTRWYREFSYCNYQLLFEEDKCSKPSLAKLGFGKDKTNDTYKVVCLYNSSELGGLVEDTTVCEVFDFTTNAWRYVVPSSPYQVLYRFKDPLYFDGSLYWLTKGRETTMVLLSFDLHTETFQDIFETPFPHRHNRFSFELVMCNLDDRLCVFENLWPKQVIWSFDSDNKTWTEIYSIDLNKCSCCIKMYKMAFIPLAVLDKDKLLFCEPNFGVSLQTLDLKTKSYRCVYQTLLFAKPLCYFQSLISF